MFHNDNMYDPLEQKSVFQVQRKECKRTKHIPNVNCRKTWCKDTVLQKARFVWLHSGIGIGMRSASIGRESAQPNETLQV